MPSAHGQIGQSPEKHRPIRKRVLVMVAACVGDGGAPSHFLQSF
jgi:hypothetical protein